MFQLHELSPGLCFSETGVLPAVPQSHFSSRASWVQREEGDCKKLSFAIGSLSQHKNIFLWQAPKICVSLNQEFTVSLS